MSNGDSNRAIEALKAFAKLFALTFKRNYGPFFLALLTLLMTVGALIAAIQTELHHNATTSQSLKELLSDTVIPPRNKDHVAVTAAALEILERMVRANAKDAKLLTDERDAFATKVEAEIRARLHSVGAVGVELEPCSASRKALTTRGGRQLVFVPEQLASLPAEAICTPCESKTGPDTDPNVNTQGTAASTASLTSSFNSPTPSACATCNPAKPAIRGQRVSRLTQDEAERAAAWADVLSEVAVADSLRSDASYTVVQAFYVSAHGVTSNWSQNGRPSCDLYTNDDGYSLAERPYMIALRNDLRKGITGPVANLGLYIDAGGKGIVATTCVADVDDDPKHLRGAACVDYAPTPKSGFYIGQTANFGPLTGRIEAPPFKASELDERTNVSCLEDPDDIRSPRRQRAQANAANAGNPICHVPLSTDKRLWLQLSYREPDLWRWLCLCLLIGTSVGVLVYSTKITAAWRAAEARLGLLRDLPAAIMQVGSGPHAKILGASDRAEELVDHELPSFMVPGPDFDSAIETQFWMLFEKSGFELERTPDGKEKLVHIPEIASAIISKREKGLSSTYWVRLRSGKFDEDSRWLEVQGTPELGARSKNATSFSLITRPNQVRLEQLRQALAPGGSV